MKHSQVYLIAVVVAVTLLPNAASACTAPAAPGVRICTPGAGQTVHYPAQITAAATAESGRKITAIAVYANGAKVLQQNGVNQITDVDYSLVSGDYHVVINAWDNTGHLYTSHTSFSVVGGQPTSCAPPAPGVLFCTPANGSLQPTNNVEASVGARGNNSSITRMQVFVDGSLMQDGAQSNLQFTAGFGNAGTHTLSAKAWDKAGHVYSATTKFKTYYDGVCSPKGCAPGVFVQSPADGQPVSTTFPLRANVENNPAPITAMKAYLDGVLVASSSGPSIIANVDASRGQHVLIINAWDTKGALYRTTQSITVQ